MRYARKKGIKLVSKTSKGMYKEIRQKMAERKAEKRLQEDVEKKLSGNVGGKKKGGVKGVKKRDGDEMRVVNKKESLITRVGKRKSKKGGENKK